MASRVQADPEHCEGALNSDSKTSSKEDKLLISPAIDPLAFPRQSATRLQALLDLAAKTGARP